MKKFLSFLILSVLLLTMCACNQAKDPESIITVNYNAKVHKRIHSISFDFELTNEMREEGFLSVKKENDDLAVYEIKQKDYDKFIDKITTLKKEIFDRYTTNYAPYITSVTYNDDLTKITIAVSKTDYENLSFEQYSGNSQIRSCISNCKLNVSTYHSISDGDFKDSEIKIVDSITGETLETIICPDALFNN